MALGNPVPGGGPIQQQLHQAHAHIGELQRWISQVRGQEVAAAERELREITHALERSRQEAEELRAELGEASAELKSIRERVIDTRDQFTLQEVGIYDYAHPLEDALAYKDALDRLRAQIKDAAKTDAVTCQVNWAVNGSVKEGQKMGTDLAKLMLRAYNVEADNAVKTVKPINRQKTKERLSKARDSIAKLGAALHIVISADYHRHRLDEIDLTADYRMKVEEEREIERANRERLREEAKVAAELERERDRLRKERAHYEAAAAKLRTQTDADPASVAAVEAKLAELDAEVKAVDHRAANARCGYVYVISNIGAFGEDVVKIGLTRRLEPMDRINELGDASVPFRFDVHGLFFSDDAVALEGALHSHFADRRVNLVNVRREFFYVTPREVREALIEIGNDHVLEYNEDVEAAEFRASDPARREVAAL